MINQDHILTVDDLIVEYMMAKINNGYEVFFTIPVFMEFLHFFESKAEVDDCLDDGDKLFERFFERKCERDWSNYLDSTVNPHMLRQDDKIMPTNKFSDYDRSVINTYFMPNAKREKIRGIIAEFLEGKPERELIIPDELPEEELKIGQAVAASMVDGIWSAYNEDHGKKSWSKLPKQLRQDILDFYKEASLRVAALILKDREKEAVLKFVTLLLPDSKLKISSNDAAYLPYSNYLCVIKGFEELVSYGYGRYKRSFEFNLRNKRIRNKNIMEVDDKEIQKLVNALNKYSYSFDDVVGPKIIVGVPGSNIHFVATGPSRTRKK